MKPIYKIRHSIILSILVALVIRWIYHIYWAGLDFWGDAYHHWLISRITLSNRWIYTDYKGLETIWLPGYHYLISAAMSAWGRYDLLPAHVTNMILGAVACGLVTWVVCYVTHRWFVGLGAGLTLAFLPWHIAYSHINMPEVMAGLLLLLLLLAAYRDWSMWLPLLGLVGSLTRHELTLSIFVIGIWLWHQRGWSRVRRLWLGSAMGLVAWSVWSWYRTGDLLSWWARSVAAVAHDAQFNTTAGTRLADVSTLFRTLSQAYPLFVVLGLTAIVLIAGRHFYQWRYQLYAEIWLLIAVVGAHWLVLGRSFVNGYLPVADPRFVLITLPVLVTVGALAIYIIPNQPARWSLTLLSLIILTSSFVNQVPKFSERAYIIQPEKAAGEFLGESEFGAGRFNCWVDAPAAIYFSALDPERFFSSDFLLPEAKRFQDNTRDIVTEAIKEHNLRYILWEDVSYTFVGEIWPQMAGATNFEQGDYLFEPVFRYSGWELQYGAAPTSIWQITNTNRPE